MGDGVYEATHQEVSVLSPFTHEPRREVQAYMKQKQIIFPKTPHLFTLVHSSTPQVQHNIPNQRSIQVSPTPRPSTEVVNPQELDKIPP